MVPRPITAGGGTASTNASWMAAIRWFNAPAMAGPLRLGVVRSSNGLRVKKTMPALGATLKPLMLKPGNATAASTPGVFRPMSDILRMTASVRSSDEPSGNCAKATRYCLSCVGTKPVGTRLKLQPVRNTRPA